MGPAKSTVGVGWDGVGVENPGRTQAVRIIKKIRAVKIRLRFMVFFLEMWNEKSLPAIIAERLD
jgi:hypothetical protein